MYCRKKKNMSLKFHPISCTALSDLVCVLCRWRHSDSSSGGVSAGRSERRDSVSTVGESLVGDDASARPCRPLPLFYQCDEFYFITDPEDHIYQHFPDDPAWQLLEVPLSMTEVRGGARRRRRDMRGGGG